MDYCEEMLEESWQPLLPTPLAEPVIVTDLPQVSNIHGNTAPTTPPPSMLATPLPLTWPHPLFQPPLQPHCLLALNQHRGLRCYHQSICSFISCSSYPWHSSWDLQVVLHELIQVIREETNRYTREVMGPAKYEQWTPVSTKELEAFLGLNFLMGLNPKPSVEDYWCTDPVYHYQPNPGSAIETSAATFTSPTTPPCRHLVHPIMTVLEKSDPPWST